MARLRMVKPKVAGPHTLTMKQDRYKRESDKYFKITTVISAIAIIEFAILMYIRFK
jgi:hypothetical protein